MCCTIRNGRPSRRWRRRSTAPRDTQRKWIQRAESDEGGRSPWADKHRALAAQGPGEARASSGERDPAQYIGIFRSGGVRPPTQAMRSFIETHRDEYGVGPSCNVLPIIASTYYEGKAREADHRRLPVRARRGTQIRPVWERKTSGCMGCMGCARCGASSIAGTQRCDGGLSQSAGTRGLGNMSSLTRILR